MDVSTMILHANGLAFTAATCGPADGELVLFLHGFPDTAATFEHQLAALGAAGYRCVAPTMRGYEPSSQPQDDDYSAMALAGDVVGWLDDLGASEAHVVGHDWGAVVAYTVASHHGARVRSATAMAVPPVPRIPDAVRRVPSQLRLSWYMNFFQIRGVAEAALQARDWALLRWFWPQWSPGSDAPASLVPAFQRPGVLGAALQYYRQNATPLLLMGLRQNPAMEVRPGGAPMMILHGEADGCMDPRLFDHAVFDEDFPLGLRRELLPGVGHFLHLEAPEQVNTRLVDWLGTHGQSGDRLG